MKKFGKVNWAIDFTLNKFSYCVTQSFNRKTDVANNTPRLIAFRT